MIAKQIIGKDFAGALRYVATKEDAYKIGGNLGHDDLAGMIGEFRESELLRPSLKRCVYHATLSTASEEALSDRSWRKIANDYLDEMGFRGHQYVIYRHNDTTHHHIHIIASRIAFADGEVAKDSWNYYRSQNVIREIEEQYGLSRTPNSWETARRAPTTGECRLSKRLRKPIERVQMQKIVSATLDTARNLDEFCQSLASKNIEVRFYYGGDAIKGISFGSQRGVFAGYHLGKAYTWSAIARRFQENAAKLGDETPTEPPHDEQMAPGFLKELNTDSDSHQSKTILGDFNQKSNAKPSASSSGSIKRGDVETEEYRNAYEGMAKAELGSDWATKGAAFEIDVAVIQRALKKKIPPTVALAILSEGQVARNLGVDWEKKERYLKTVEQVLNGEVLDKEIDKRQYPRR